MLQFHQSLQLLVFFEKSISDACKPMPEGFWSRMAHNQIESSNLSLEDSRTMSTMASRIKLVPQLNRQELRLVSRNNMGQTNFFSKRPSSEYQQKSCWNHARIDFNHCWHRFKAKNKFFIYVGMQKLKFSPEFRESSSFVSPMLSSKNFYRSLLHLRQEFLQILETLIWLCYVLVSFTASQLRFYFSLLPLSASSCNVCFSSRLFSSGSKSDYWPPLLSSASKSVETLSSASWGTFFITIVRINHILRITGFLLLRRKYILELPFHFFSRKHVFYKDTR